MWCHAVCRVLESLRGIGVWYVVCVGWHARGLSGAADGPSSGIYAGARRMVPAARCMRRGSAARSHGARLRNARCICGALAVDASRMVGILRCASHAELDGDGGWYPRRACGASHACAGLRLWKRRRRDPHGEGRRAVRRRGDIRHRSICAHGRAAMRAGADARGRCGVAFRTEATPGVARLCARAGGDGCRDRCAWAVRGGSGF